MLEGTHLKLGLGLVRTWLAQIKTFVVTLVLRSIINGTAASLLIKFLIIF